MKEKKLLHALSNVDERYLEEMHETKTVKKRPAMKLVWVAAAVLSLMTLLMGSAMIKLWPATCDLFKYPLTDPALVAPENIKLTVAEVNPTSMKVYCKVEGVEDGKDAIYILPNGPFTLDRKTDEGWEPLTPKYEDADWKAYRMLTGGTTDWYISWTGIYGILEPGTYRYNAVVLEGKAPSSVEFTVTKKLDPTMKELLENTLSSYSYCVRYTAIPEISNMDHLSRKDREVLVETTHGNTTEYRKYGDQLLVLDYFDDQPEQPSLGMMVKNGQKYRLDHEGDDSTNPIIGWSLWPDVDQNRFTSWVTDLLTGNNCTLQYAPDGTPESVVRVTKRPNQAYGITVTWTETWELDTTDPGAVAAVFARQDVNKPRTFSWEEEQKTLEPLEVSFHNTQPQPITTAPQAAERAMAECTVDYTKVIVYHDETAGMWKVEFQNFYGYQGYQYVYLTDDGLTYAVANGAPKT